MRTEAVELSEVVQRSLESVMPLMHEKEHRVEGVASITPLYVRGDTTRLVQSLATCYRTPPIYGSRGNIRVEVLARQIRAQRVHPADRAHRL